MSFASLINLKFHTTRILRASPHPIAGCQIPNEIVIAVIHEFYQYIRLHRLEIWVKCKILWKYFVVNVLFAMNNGMFLRSWIICISFRPIISICVRCLRNCVRVRFDTFFIVHQAALQISQWPDFFLLPMSYSSCYSNAVMIETLIIIVAGGEKKMLDCRIYYLIFSLDLESWRV